LAHCHARLRRRCSHFTITIFAAWPQKIKSARGICEIDIIDAGTIEHLGRFAFVCEATGHFANA